MPHPRSAVSKKDTWDIKAMFQDEAAFKEALEKVKQRGFSDIESFKENISPENLLEALQLYFLRKEELEELYVYAHLRHDEDILDEANKQSFEVASELFYLFEQATSFLIPSILEFDEKDLQDKKFDPYRRFLDLVFHTKPYTLNKREEMLLSLSSKSKRAYYKSFSALNDADLSFPEVETKDKEKLPLTHALYGKYMQEGREDIRKSAFFNYMGTFGQHKNTFCEILKGHLEGQNFERKARNFPSSLHMALHPHQIDVSVYKNLIKTTRNHVSALAESTSLRKEILALKTLHLYDLSAPLLNESSKTITYEEAEEAVINSFAYLGTEAKQTIEKGLRIEKWVDRYENTNKRSGAYSSGSYRSYPYILMNFKGTYRDLFTLAHEAGHSFHTHLSNKSQPYQTASYPIFLAEIASTCQEELLFQTLLEKTKDPKTRFTLLTLKWDDIRQTFFRQVLFAEFELAASLAIEEGRPLTAGDFDRMYASLIHDYYGEDLTLDPLGHSEWTRIPHFYYNFYVYQYATGISAAHYFAKRILEKDEKALAGYLHLLKSGSSKPPLTLLEEAGLSMTKSDAVDALIDKYRSMTMEIKNLHKQLALSSSKC